MAANEGFVKGKSPTVEQDAFVMSTRSTHAQMAPKPEISGEGTADQSSVDAIRAAITAKDGAQVLSLLSGASKAVLDVIGSDSSLVETLQDLPEAERNSAYDYLHLSITDANLLVDIIYQRFGVMLLGKKQNSKNAKAHLKQKRKSNVWAESVSDNEIDFSAEHAQQIYSGYMCVPQSALDQITFVFSETNQADYLQGYAMTPQNNICLNSQVGQEAGRNAVNTGMGAMGGMFGGMVENAGGAGTVSSDKDAAYNAVFTQWTAIHELGHVIDSQSRFSSTKDFRACSGWDEFEDAEKVVKDEYLKDGNVENPYLDDFSDDEKELAQKVAVDIAKNENDLNSAKKVVSKNKGKLSHYSQDEFIELIDDSLESMSDVGGMNLFKAASLSRKDEVWYDMKGYRWMDKHMKRPAHFYKNAWWSYDKNIRDEGKISCYQYVFPREDFAEAYACYYYTEILDQKAKSGGPMPAKLKAWFDAHKKEFEEG